MNSKVSISIVIGIGMTTFLFFAFVSMAIAQEDYSQNELSGYRQFVPEAETPIVPGGPGFVSSSPVNFKPMNASTSYAFLGPQLFNPSTEDDIYYAGIQLPHRSIITRFIGYYYDNGTEDISIKLANDPLLDPIGLIMATVSSSGAVDGYRYAETTDITLAGIDLQQYSYYILVNLPPSVDYRLIGIRVDYTYPINLPFVNK